MNHPRIWVLLGHRTGDNNQLLALAEALKLPFETRTLRFNRLRLLSRWLGPSLLSLDKSGRASLAPPWPDLVLGIGWRSVTIARWIKRMSRGRTKIVRLGNPRRAASDFDLVITTPQYPVPDAGNVLRLPLGMSRFRNPPKASEAERGFLEALPRPHRLLAVGGPARFWHLSPETVIAAAHALAGTLATVIAVTSPRTPPEIAEALSDSDAVVAPPEYRFAVLLADADEVHVTGDSVAMLSEAVLSGKPVGIIPIEMSSEGHRVLGKNPRSKRDLRRFWASLRDAGLAGTIDRPVAGQIANPADMAADAVKALLGDRVH
jgi:mitochondrial fission protein ELM1